MMNKRNRIGVILLAAVGSLVLSGLPGVEATSAPVAFQVTSLGSIAGAGGSFAP